MSLEKNLKADADEILQIRAKELKFLAGDVMEEEKKEVKAEKKPEAKKAQSKKEARKAEKKKAGLYRDVLPQDIVKYGLIPELVGRMPVITSLHDLKKEDLVRALFILRKALEAYPGRVLE